jgi:hypothetical protein|tara:strand:+ start:6211 stop:6333 length:123 start_codon:yes stop_codon:yes gene_type:complete
MATKTIYVGPAATPVTVEVPEPEAPKKKAAKKKAEPKKKK